MFSKVATENILSEQPKFKKIKPTPLPWMSTPPTAVSPYLVFPIVGGREGVQLKKEIKLFAYIYFGNYSKNNS